MSNETKEVFILTTKEAVKLLKGAGVGSKFFVHYRTDAAVQNEPTKVFTNGLFGSIKLSKADAVKLVSEILSESLEEKGGRIQITVLSYKNFTKDSIEKYYWIG